MVLEVFYASIYLFIYLLFDVKTYLCKLYKISLYVFTNISIFTVYNNLYFVSPKTHKQQQLVMSQNET